MKRISKLAAVFMISTTLIATLPLSKTSASEAERRFSSLEENEKSYIAKNVDLSNIKNREIIIRTNEKMELLLQQFTIQLVKSPDILQENQIFVVRVPENFNYQTILHKLKNSNLVESAEPNYEQVKLGFTTPNDEFYMEQWHLPKMGMGKVWESYTPKHKVTVAVVDTGVDNTHSDLGSQILKGYDFLGKDSNPMDSDGHGTSIAGIIASKTNNSMGIAGINPYAKILPIRVGTSEGIYTSDSVAGIYYAIEKGVDVINLSYGAYEATEAEYYATYEAYQKGILVVAASGNDAKTVTYPAAYPFVLSVGSTDFSDKLSIFSNYGNLLDITAPGETIVTTILNNSYGYVNGTSFAAPAVAAIASIYLAKKGKIAPNKLEYLLEKGAKVLTKNSNNWSSKSGFGRADADGTMKAKLPSTSSDYGNTRSKAKSISLNKTYKNKYELPGDSDWYKLKITKSTKVKVELSGVSNINNTIWIDQYSNGKILWEKQYNKAKIGGKESFTYSLKPGTYYFEIYDVNNHWSPSSYSFKVSKQ